MTPAELQEAAVRYAMEAFFAWLVAPPSGFATPSAHFNAIVTERMAQLAQAAAPDLDLRTNLYTQLVAMGKVAKEVSSAVGCHSPDYFEGKRVAYMHIASMVGGPK